MNLDYLAGLFDGEGCFCITRNVSRRNRMGVEIKLLAQIDLRQLSVLKQIQELLGGNVRSSREETNKYAATFKWTIWSDRAANFAQIIKDRLLIKKPQAELAIRFQNSLNQNNRQIISEEHWQALESMYQEMKFLNIRGPLGSEDIDDCDKTPWQLFTDGMRKEES